MIKPSDDGIFAICVIGGAIVMALLPTSEDISSGVGGAE